MLTDLKIRSLKPTGKAYKQYDQRGLYLEVAKSGSKLWRLRYQFAGKSKLISLGLYPTVGVAEARRKALKRPAATSSVRSLETVAREWHEYLYRHEVVPKQAERT